MAKWQNIDSARYADGRVAVSAGNGQIVVQELSSIPVVENHAQVKNNNQMADQSETSPQTSQQETNTYADKVVAPSETCPQTSQTKIEISELQTPPATIVAPAPPAAPTPDMAKSVAAETNKNAESFCIGGGYYLFIKDYFSMKLDLGVFSFLFGHAEYKENGFKSKSTSWEMAFEWNKAYAITQDWTLWFSPGIGIGYGTTFMESTYDNKTTMNDISYFVGHLHPKIGIGILSLGVFYSFNDFNFLPLDTAIFTLGLAIPLFF